MNSTMEELDELFKKWCQKHEKEENFEKTTPKALIYANDPTANKSAFIEDGIISPEYYQGKILFLLKESNERKTCDARQPIGYKNQIEDWFLRANIEQNKLCPLMKKMAHISNAINDPSCTDIEALKQVAYMNINKRGGGSYTSTKILEKYADEYRDQIMKEIEILNPNYVLCCGITDKSVFDILKDNVYEKKDCYELSDIKGFSCFTKQIKNKKTLFVKLPHLSARRDYAEVINNFPTEFPKLIKQYTQLENN